MDQDAVSVTALSLAGGKLTICAWASILCQRTNDIMWSPGPDLNGRVQSPICGWPLASPLVSDNCKQLG